MGTVLGTVIQNPWQGKEGLHKWKKDQKCTLKRRFWQNMFLHI